MFAQAFFPRLQRGGRRGGQGAATDIGRGVNPQFAMRKAKAGVQATTTPPNPPFARGGNRVLAQAFLLRLRRGEWAKWAGGTQYG
jgi:hypothetical protein